MFSLKILFNGTIKGTGNGITKDLEAYRSLRKETGSDQ
jgi:hypothetical protein